MISKLYVLKNNQFNAKLNLIKKSLVTVFVLLISSTNYAFCYSLEDAIGELGADAPHNLPGPDRQDLSGKPSDITDIIQNIADTLTYAAASVAVLIIIWNAFNMVTATGDSDTLSNAKKGLTWAIIGLFGIIFAYVIVSTIILFTYAGEG